SGPARRSSAAGPDRSGAAGRSAAGSSAACSERCWCAGPRAGRWSGRPSDTSAARRRSGWPGRTALGGRRIAGLVGTLERPGSAGPGCAPGAAGTAPVRDGESILALVGGAAFGAPHEWWSPRRTSRLDQASEDSPPSSSVRVVLHSQKFQKIVGLIVIGSTPCSSVL